MEMQWEFTTVKTLTADDEKRIRIPDATPRQTWITGTALWSWCWWRPRRASRLLAAALERLCL